MKIKQAKQITISTLLFMLIAFTTALAFRFIDMPEEPMKIIRGAIIFLASFIWIGYVLTITLNVVIDLHGDS